MTKAAWLALVLAACGGTSTPSTTPTSTTTSAATTTPAETAEPAAPENDVVAQAELAQQYDLGKKIYVEKACNTCHGDNGEGNPKNPAVIGPDAFPEQAPAISKLRRGIPFNTAKDVMDFVKAKMPIKTPNTLTDEEAAAVTSWMLSESKVNITRKLDASNAASVSLR